MANLRDDIALLQEQIALLEERAIAEKNYGRGVKRDQEGRQDRIAAYNKTLDEILDKEKKIIGVQKSQRDIGNQLGDIQKQYGDNILKQFGLEDNIATLKEAAKTNDAEGLRQVGQLSNILDDVLKGEMDALDVREAAVGLSGEMREYAEKIADTLENTPDMQKKFKLKAELFQKFDGLFGGISKTIQTIMASTGFIGLIVAGIGLLLNYLVQAVKQAAEIRRELGTSVVESARLSINMERAAAASAMFGGTLDAGRDAVKELVSETGILEDINLKNSAALGKFAANSGLSAAETAKLLKTMKLVTGESIATNLNTLETFGNFASSRGVLRSKVFQDLASNTEIFARAGQSGALALQRAAVQAAKIGTSLSTLDSLADNLLDVEGTLRAQQELSALTGQNIDLTRLMQLANSNNLEGMMAEMQNQFGNIEIDQLGRFTQNRLKQLGIPLDQLQSMNRGEVVTEDITPPVAKDQLEALNNNSAIATEQLGVLKTMAEQQEEGFTLLRREVSNLRRT